MARLLLEWPFLSGRSKLEREKEKIESGSSNAPPHPVREAVGSGCEAGLHR